MWLPDRGRKLFSIFRLDVTPSFIEKCSSPIGDGNDYEWFVSDDPYIIEKCSSPIGDGNTLDSKRLEADLD